MLASNEWLPVGGVLGIGTSYRSTTDQRVLVVYFDNTALLFDSQGDLDRYVARLESAPRETHVLDNYPAFDADFIARIEAYVSELPSMVSLPAQALDRTLKSLKRVDAALSAMTIAQRKRALVNLVAYAGEVVRHEAGGEWQMTAAGTTLEPAIVGTRVGIVPLGVMVLDVLPLVEREAGLYDVLQALLS